MATNADDTAPEQPKKKKSFEEALRERGVDEYAWRTLSQSLYPGADPYSVLMVIDYCRARKLDPLKKPCHIMPMEVKIKDRDGERYEWRDVVAPGIYELRTTAQRTGLYLGHTKPKMGPMIDIYGRDAPEYVECTFFRRDPATGEKVGYPVTTWFEEVCGLSHGKLNKRWNKSPRQMLMKCNEAAGLREAFPEELGGEHTDDELSGIALADPGTQSTTITPGTARTTAAADALRARLEKLPAGESVPTIVTPGAEMKETVTQSAPSPGRDMFAETDHTIAAERVAKKAETTMRKADPVPAPTWKWADMSEALAHLYAQQSPAALRAAWNTLQNDYEFAGKEIPADLEAHYGIRLDELNSK